VRVVEQTPRLEIAAIKRLALWSDMATSRHVIITTGGTTVQIELTTDNATYGTRFYFRCSCCHSRRRHLFVVAGSVACRSCHGLLYRQQSWPRSRWRVDVGRPTLRAWRRGR